MTLRYAVFAGLGFYPAGGWQDFVTSCAYLTEAMAVCRLAVEDTGGAPRRANIEARYPSLWTPMDWTQIVDLTTGQIVAGRGAR